MVQEFENTGSNPATLEWTKDKLELLLMWPDMTTTLLHGSQNEAHAYQVGGFDQKIDFGGTSGGTQTYDVNISKDDRITSALLLSELIGVGPKTLFLSATTSVAQQAVGNSVMGSSTMAGADITVTYNYVPVPESAVWAVACALSALVLGLRGRMGPWR
jgi:hypothetical protein